MADYDDFKQRVRDATDIAEVIGQYVTLKKRGRNLLGLCPFHDEKTPSFTVHPDRQFYHCFGCGKGGDVFTFLMEQENWSFPEALRYLAERANIPLPRRRSPAEQDRYAKLYEANAVAAEFFSRMIHEPEGKHALAYITGRGVPRDKLAHLQIGYAPDHWDGLIKFARRRDLTEQVLTDAGLVIRHETKGSYYDRFRNRLTFAICNLSGRPIAFGARALSPDETAKYINSPETPIYRKSTILYGLDKARDEIRRQDASVVVEGYTDWVSLYLANISNVVASSGTAFTAEQARQLRRFSQNVILLFDADPAGDQAALRGVEVLFREGLDVKIAVLPDGLDPDTAIRKQGRDSITQALADAQEYVSYKVSLAHQKLSSGNLLSQEAVIRELLDTTAAIPDRVRRSLLIRQISEATRIPEDDLRAQLTRKRQPSGPAADKQAPSGPFINGPYRWEAEFLHILLRRDDLRKRAKAEIHSDDFKNEHLADLFQAIVGSKSASEINPADIGATIEEQALAAEIALMPVDDTSEAYADYVAKFVARRPKRDTVELKKRLQDAERRGDQKEAQRLLKELAQKTLTKD